MEETRAEHDGLPYLLWTPEGEAQGAIVFLHGIGERAEKMPLEEVPVHSLPALAREGNLPSVGGSAFPFLVACPQTERQSWGPDAGRVAELASALASEGLDSPRCYLTGISMGSYGCWLAAAGNSVFSALVPVSGGVPREAHEVRAPAWVFTGADDEMAPPEEVERELEQANPPAQVRYEKVPGGTHSKDFWNPLYGRADIYEWMLEQDQPG